MHWIKSLFTFWLHFRCLSCFLFQHWCLQLFLLRFQILFLNFVCVIFLLLTDNDCLLYRTVNCSWKNCDINVIFICILQSRENCRMKIDRCYGKKKQNLILICCDTVWLDYFNSARGIFSARLVFHSFIYSIQK